jgi:MFS transporter, ACS family, hexuronate transporter
LVFVIPFVRSVPLAIALFTLVQVMCLSWLTLSNVLVATLFDKSSVATAAGVLNALGTVGAAIFSFFAGTIVEEFGYGTIFTISAFLHPVAAILLYFFYCRRRPRPSDGVALGQLPA